MSSFAFFAMLSRMKSIGRWGLMRNVKPENLSEHSHDVAVLTHLLCVLRNERFGGTVDVSRAVLHALYHDCCEILTGDLPTPVKYFNPEIKNAYKQVETVANHKLLSMLPEDLRKPYTDCFFEEDAEIRSLVKAADKLSALIKCIEEKNMGNNDFSKAKETLQKSLLEMCLPEVDVFFAEFLPSFDLTLDELD